MALLRRPRTVRRQLEHWGGIGKLPTPIVNLLFANSSLHPLPLPNRKIDVLNRQVGQR